MIAVQSFDTTAFGGPDPLDSEDTGLGLSIEPGLIDHFHKLQTDNQVVITAIDAPESYRVDESGPRRCRKNPILR